MRNWKQLLLLVNTVLVLFSISLNAAQGNTTIYRNEKWGNFSGNDYAVCDCSNIDLWNKDFTISVWFRPEKFSDDCPTIISCGTTFQGEWMLRLDNGVLQFYADEGNLKLRSRRKEESYDKDIHHGAIVRKGNNFSLYLDGGKQDSKECPGPKVNAIKELLVGSGDKEENRWWKGLIGDISIYSNAIDEKAIVNIYKQDYYSHKYALAKKRLDKLSKKFNELSKLPIYIEKSKSMYNDSSKKLAEISDKMGKCSDIEKLNHIWNQIESLEQKIDLLENKFNAWTKLDKDSSESKDNSFFISVASSVDKISDKKTLDLTAYNAVYIESAANEYENVQILVIPATEKPFSINVKCSDLVNDNGNGKIPSGNIKVYNIEYVNDVFPDPLRPFSGRMEINPSICAQYPLWISLYVPDSTPAGIYSGNISIQESEVSGKTKNIPIKVKVWDFAIPVKHNLAVETNIRINKLALFYYGLSGAEHPEKYISTQMYLDDLKYLLNYRLISKASSLNGMDEIYTVPFIGKNWSADNHSLDFEIFDKIARMYIENGADLIFAGQLGGHFANAKKQKELALSGLAPFYPDMKDYLPEIYKHLKEKKWLDKAYFYGWDEPCGSKDWNQLMEELQIVNKMAPGIKVIFPIYFFEQNTKPLMKTWIKQITSSFTGKCIFTISYSSLLKNGDPDFYRGLSARGETVWLYDSGGKSFFLKSKGILHRNIFWAVRELGLRGFMIWGTVDWRDLQLVEKSGKIAYELSSNGDGFLLYPAGKSLHDGLIPSIRLELMRDGIEDWEYFHMLEEKVKYIEKYKNNEDAPKLVQESNLLLNIEKENLDAEFVLKRRKMIAEQIEKLNRFIGNLPDEIQNKESR